VEDRLLGLLSLLAERFGHVGVDGVHLPLPPTHAVLGLLIGARRPTITLAVSALRERGALARTDSGGWLLPHPVEQDAAGGVLPQAV
jgi:CRP/FNR family cyclic AMP-dependent transcriptional regulator